MESPDELKIKVEELTRKLSEMKAFASKHIVDLKEKHRASADECASLRAAAAGAIKSLDPIFSRLLADITSGTFAAAAVRRAHEASEAAIVAIANVPSTASSAPLPPPSPSTTTTAATSNFLSITAEPTAARAAKSSNPFIDAGSKSAGGGMGQASSAAASSSLSASQDPSNGLSGSAKTRDTRAAPPIAFSGNPFVPRSEWAAAVAPALESVAPPPPVSAAAADRSTPRATILPVPSTASTHAAVPASAASKNPFPNAPPPPSSGSATGASNPYVGNVGASGPNPPQPKQSVTTSPSGTNPFDSMNFPNSSPSPVEPSSVSGSSGASVRPALSFKKTFAAAAPTVSAAAVATDAQSGRALPPQTNEPFVSNSGVWRPGVSVVGEGGDTTTMSSTATATATATATPSSPVAEALPHSAPPSIAEVSMEGGGVQPADAASPPLSSASAPPTAAPPPAAAAPRKEYASREEVTKLSARELKAALAARDVDTSGCVEKSDFVALLNRHLFEAGASEGGEEREASTPSQDAQVAPDADETRADAGGGTPTSVGGGSLHHSSVTASASSSSAGVDAAATDAASSEGASSGPTRDSESAPTPSSGASTSFPVPPPTTEESGGGGGGGASAAPVGESDAPISGVDLPDDGAIGASPIDTANDDPFAPLPDGWEVADAGDGKLYYYHQSSRISRWTRPTGDTAERISSRLAAEEEATLARQAARMEALDAAERAALAERDAADGVRGKLVSAIAGWAEARGWTGVKGLRRALKAKMPGAESLPKRAVISLLSGLSAVPVDGWATLECPSLSVPKGWDWRAHAGGDAVSEKDVKKAFLAAVRALHPDKTKTQPLALRLAGEEVFGILKSGWDALAAHKDGSLLDAT